MRSTWIGGALALWLACCSNASTSKAPPSADARTDAAPPAATDAAPLPADAATDTAPPSDDPDPVFSAAEWTALQELAPARLPAPPHDVTNAWSDDPAAATFGEALFLDTSFSGPLLDSDNNGGPGSLGKAGETGRVACASCHVPDSFSDTRSFQRQISLGAGWGRRRAPSLLDVGQAKLLMWDGRRDALFNQPFGPIESVVEMNSSRLFFAKRVYSAYRATYEAIFGALPPLDDTAQFPDLSARLTGCQPANPSDPQPSCDGTFHGSPGDGAEYDSMSPENQDAVTRVVVNAGKAIAAYERTLACGPGPFDAWIHAEGSVSRSAQRGAALFVGRAGCVQCHDGPFMSDQAFHNVGLQPVRVQQAFIDLNDEGAAKGIAAALADPLNSLGAYSDGDDGRLPKVVAATFTGAFRTPTLRCVSQRPTFMHTGQMGSLKQAVNFFNVGGSLSGFLGTSEIQAIGLSEREVDDVVAFLETLSPHGAEP